MVADSTKELHNFAKRLKLSRSWFQGGVGGKAPHYDLTNTKRRVAISLGAIEIDSIALARMIRCYRLKWAAEEYAKAKIAMTKCMNSKMKLTCVRCAKYRNGVCPVYVAYCNKWACLQANLKVGK
jgi:hypothetical protein